MKGKKMIIKETKSGRRAAENAIELAKNTKGMTWEEAISSSSETLPKWKTATNYDESAKARNIERVIQSKEQC